MCFISVRPRRVAAGYISDMGKILSGATIVDVVANFKEGHFNNKLLIFSLPGSFT